MSVGKGQRSESYARQLVNCAAVGGEGAVFKNEWKSELLDGESTRGRDFGVSFAVETFKVCAAHRSTSKPNVRAPPFETLQIIKSLKANSPLLRTKSFGIKVEKRQWLETGALLLWMTCGPASWLVIYLLLVHFTLTRYAALAYLVWIYLDRDTCERGGRRRQWFRRLKWFEYMRDYFPVELVKTADLPPDRNYLFALFPHGIISMSALLTFGSDALRFEETFKGIKTHLCTLKVNFKLPIVREVALACGAVAASKESLNWILSHPEKGKSATLIVGGAAESMYTEPGTYKICLKNRKGFCRVALKNGASLVPVFSFGEIEILDQVQPERHPWLNTFQLWFKKITGIAPIIFFGKGIFGDYIGLIPRKHPLTVVVGSPIEVKKIKNPTKEQVEELHGKFMEKIVELFNREKHKYLEEPGTELIVK